MTVIARRIVLRLDPARPMDGALPHAMRLAKAFHAELAARMIADTRFAGAMAVVGPNVERQLRHAETTLRRELTGLGNRENTAWTFEVVHCAGILARECSMCDDDIVAIELPRIEVSRAELCEEIAATLTHARGVLLLPATERVGLGPVVAIVEHRERVNPLIEQADRIAEALNAPLKIIEHNGKPPARHAERQEAGDIATAIRRLGAILAVVDAKDPIADAFIARPRFLRELATPLLLLKSA
jgi:hypothetical protein